MVGYYRFCLNLSGCFLKPVGITIIGLVLLSGLLCYSCCADTGDVRLIVYSAPDESGGYEPVPPDVPLPENVTFSLRSPLLGFITVDTDPNETVYIKNELLNLPWVHEIELDPKRSSGSVEKDELVQNSSPGQWAIERTGVREVLPFEGNSSVCRVAVINTGADWTHPDAVYAIRGSGYDWAGQDSRPVDEDGYGTALCGLVSLVAGNISGSANSSLLIIPERIGVTGDDFAASLSALAIAHATDAGSDIILTGYGGAEPSRAEDRAIAYAKEHGVLLIAPAGDEDSNNMHYPSDNFDVISVGSVAKTDGLSYFSNYGIYTELVAPGEDLIVPCLNRSYCRGTGTGFAAAEVAGIAALVKSRYPGLNSEEVRSVLQSSAIDLGRTGRDMYYGYGLINAPAAIRAAEDLALQKTLMAYSEQNSRQMKRSQGFVNQALCELKLETGWNFISIPGPLRSAKTARDLFSGINTDGHTIWTYKKTGGWTPQSPDLSPAPMEGMLVYSGLKATVPLVLNINSDSTKELESGWNLAGSPYLKEMPASSLFNSTGTFWSGILTFNASTQQYDPAIISGAEGTFSDSRNLSPFSSFWIFMDSNGTFIRSSGI